jgi:deoxyribonuclease V
MNPGPWPSTAGELEEFQVDLAERARAAPSWSIPRDRPLLIAAVFSAFAHADGGRRAWAAAALMENSRLLEAVTVPGQTGAAYASGRLALQRGPLLEAAMRGLELLPDILLVNATGRDHPRGGGLAVHLGAALAMPTVGVTDHPLVAAVENPGPERGDSAPLLIDGELVGYVVRTRRGARPVIAHAGWRTDPQTAREVVEASTAQARTPEPLRVARFLARVQRALDEGRLTSSPPSIAAVLRPG